MNKIKVYGYFSQAERAKEKEESRQRDLSELKSGRLTLKDLNQRNRAIPKIRVRRAKVVSWGF
jgi:hypothetical protein